MTVICYVTCANEKEAHSIAKSLLEKRLIACANIVPKMHSFYWWKGKLLEEQPESLLLLKTTKQKKARVVQEIKKMHSYSVPCIEFIHAKANPEYEKWVIGELT